VKKLFAVVFLLGWLVALGAGTNGTQTANLSWTAPSQYTDGTNLSLSDIAFYTVQWTTAGGATQTKVVNAPTVTATVAALCGTANFTVTVTTSATAVYPNATSAPSGPVPFVSSVTCAPNPVTGLTVK